MIENIRKYSGLMIVIFVVLFISFFFMDTGSMRALGGGGTAIKIDGRSYSAKEVERLGSSSMQLLGGLAGGANFELLMFQQAMVGNPRSESEAVENFFVSRMILRQARDEFGIYPGEDEISSYIRGLPLFAGPDGGFDAQSYREFVQNRLGRFGMTEEDVRDLVADFLVSRQLERVIGSGLAASREATAAQMALDNQQIDVQLGHLAIDPYQEKIEPTEEEIREYWETIQDSFTTEEKRSFSYVIVTPELPELPEAGPPAAEDEDEAARAAREEREQERARIAEERRKKQLEISGRVDDFLVRIEEEEDATFESLAAEYGWEVGKTPLFPASEPPAELDVSLRNSTRASRAVEELFALQETSDPFSNLSDALAVGENEWLVARLQEVEPSRVKTFEEARDEARAQYIAEKALEDLKAAGEEAIATIREAMEAGATFADAAKEAGLEGVHEVEDLTRFYRPQAENEPQNLFEAARTVEPGTLAELIVEPDRVFILHVGDREVVREPNQAERIDAMVGSAEAGLRTYAYMAWLGSRLEAANVESAYR